MAVEMREKSLQSSILFMQQEHANTLKALHEEIQHLQKRCSELTFQLAMEATTTPDEDLDKKRISELEKELSELKLKSKLSSEEAETSMRKNEKIRILENQLKAQEMKYTNELKAKNLTVAQLQTELEQKATTIADLANKLRSMHRERASNWKTVIEQNPVEAGGLTPTPPKDGLPQRYRRRSSNGRKSLEMSQPVLNNVIPRPPSSRRLPITDNMLPEHVPDPTPFLNRRRESKEKLKIHSGIQPLPPIGLGGNSPDVSSNLALKYGGKEVSSPSSSPEVEILAVDAVSRRHHRVSRTQQYQSESNGT